MTYPVSVASTCDPVNVGVMASAVRNKPHTTQGWRPTSAVNQPVSTAMNPVGQAKKAHHRNQREVSKRPRQRSQLPSQLIAKITKPMPTIARKAKNGITTGGQSL